MISDPFKNKAKKNKKHYTLTVVSAFIGRCSPESVNFNDRAMGGVVRAGLKNFKLCMLLDILLYFEEIKHLVLGGGRAVGPRGSSFFWTLTEISPESVNFQREDC